MVAYEPMTFRHDMHRQFGLLQNKVIRECVFDCVDDVSSFETRSPVCQRTRGSRIPVESKGAIHGYQHVPNSIAIVHYHYTADVSCSSHQSLTDTHDLCVPADID